MTHSNEEKPVVSVVSDGDTQAMEGNNTKMRRLKSSKPPAEKSKEFLAHLNNLDALIGIAIRGGASDLLFKVGLVPMFRLNGDLYPLRDGPRIDSEMLECLTCGLLNEEQIKKFEQLQDIDFSYSSQKSGRVRVNLFRQRGEIGLVVRVIHSEIPTIDNLGMAPIVKQLASLKRGLILVTGATGSGKSTTLAAMIDHINRNKNSHIITIEDPVEYMHTDRKSLINQRELGLDTLTFAQAIKSALRQAPDVILVGELRDAETIEVALQAAETGHLVFSTMHTNDAADAMVRILSSLGADKEPIVRQQLAENLKGVISQRLVKRADKKGRVAAQEIMVLTATIREKILKGASPNIVRDFVSQGQNYGMQTFDQHLFQLYAAGYVEYEEAYANATNRDDFDLLVRGISNATG
jgi:twitching motility protein PilT